MFDSPFDTAVTLFAICMGVFALLMTGTGLVLLLRNLLNKIT